MEAPERADTDELPKGVVEMRSYAPVLMKRLDEPLMAGTIPVVLGGDVAAKDVSLRILGGRQVAFVRHPANINVELAYKALEPRRVTLRLVRPAQGANAPRVVDAKTADVAGAPIPSFRLRLPASLRVSQVRVPPDADWFIDRDEEGQQLKVALKEPSVGKLNFAVSGSMARDSSQAEFVVPGVNVENVQSQHGQVAIHLDDDLEAVLTDIEAQGTPDAYWVLGDLAAFCPWPGQTIARLRALIE